MKDYSDDLDQDVDNIISQLRNTKREVQTKKESTGIEKSEDIEKFVIEKASSVVTDCADMLSHLTDAVKDSFDPNIIESVAELAKATSSIMETLAKFDHNKKNNETKIKLQEMNIESRKQQLEDPKLLGAGGGVGVFLTHDDILGMIGNAVTQKQEEAKKIEDKTVDI